MLKKDKNKAQNESPEVQSAAPEISEKDKSRARQWFKKAEDCRDRRDYDYAIQC